MKQAAGRGRALWLGGALAAALLAAQWVSGEDGGADSGRAVEDTMPRKEVRPPENQPAKETGRDAANEAEQLQLERLERRKFSAQAGDIFRNQSWAPPPPPASSKPPPPAPPPLQFKYLGRVTEGDETRVFLALAERNYIVRPGENIDSQYRMDAVNEHAITLTYLPLNAKQMLAIAGPGNVQ
ncbi:secretion system X translation initiation factor [Nitrosovibrio tenuis]|uniref:Secretion system X translation initiation factor n=1 Tax=Nitrosovibrio tenuis TaxID=1233 RepID=A0A1H7LQ66_9PROT|nr:secretion system X translation initiation factor [Nitrosovibrio tenuis]SEL01103.1 hypothetical protein SAMN05216387_104132 [Nitrosovibrio tenuis]